MDRNRFALMFPEDKARGTKVVLVGCGGIGSYAGPVLARLGVGALRLVDFDTVEETNIATQNLSRAALGKPKVEAVAAECQGTRDDLFMCDTMNAKFGPGMAPPGWMVVAAVDSIRARREIWEVFKGSAEKGQVFIDPRMGAESFELWVVRRGSEFEKEYETALYDKTPRTPLPCGARAIAYTGAYAGALVGSSVRRAVMEPGWETWVVGDVGVMGSEVLREIKEEVTDVPGRGRGRDEEAATG